MNGLPISAGGARFAAAQTAPTDLAPLDVSNVCWRNYVGVASLVACPTLLLAFISLRYGLAPLVGLRAFVALYALGVVPGYLVQRYVLRLSHRTPFEDLASSWLLGTLLVPALWYVCCCVGISLIFYPTMLALATTAPFALGWHRNVAARLRNLVSTTEAPVLWLALGLAVLWSWQLDLVSFRDGQVLVLPHNDHMVHTSWLAELARGTPPETIPFIACLDKSAYHYLPDVWCDMIRRFAGTDARTAYFCLALPLRYVLVCLACYLALVGRFGRTAAVVGSACVLAFTGYHGSWFVLTNPLLTYLYWNFPASFGLCSVLLILYLVSLLNRDQPRPILLGISMLSGLLLWHKANFALVTMPAVAVLCGLVLLRRRDYGWLLACLAMQAMLVGIRMWDSATSDLSPEMVFEPFRFVSYMWWKGTLWIKAHADAESIWITLPIQAMMSVQRNVNALPAILKWPAVLILCLAYAFQVGIPVAVYARLRCGFGRFRPRANPVDVVVLTILLSCAAGFVLLPIQRALVWNISMHLFALVTVLLLMLMGPVLCDLVTRALRGGRTATTVGAIVLALALVGNTYALGRKALGPTADVQDVITPDLYACYRYVEAATPRDAMILHPRFEQGLMSAGLLTQRRIVLEPTLDGQCDMRAILSDLRVFYAGTNSTRARVALDRYGVDYVVADRSLPRRAGYESFLTEVFHANNMAVFRTTVALGR